MTDLRREIEQLLSDETAAMACLSQSELESCLERRTVLADRLAEAGQEDLSALAGTLRRHDRRLAATAAGICAGLRRISELRSARTGLRTYSADGDADEIGRDPGRLLRKA